MSDKQLNWEDRFYYYNTRINPLKLIKKFQAKNLKAKEGFLTNAFGVVINPKFFPQILTGREGTVEELPIPANWHADIAEFGAALRAVDLADKSFTMIELGCGWGCWMNITGVAAKRKGLSVKLIGVEGDEGHISFVKESLSTNQFKLDEYQIYHGIAANRKGYALFPKQDVSGVSWGLAPIFDLGENETKKLLKTGKFDLLKQYSLEEISQKYEKIDLLHVDIQGGEEHLIPSSIDFLSEKVAYLLIGTHSRQIEGIMFDCLLKAGWVLEIERPALLNLDANPNVTVDGVQGWRNPRLLPIVDIVESKGKLELLTDLRNTKLNQELMLKVKITNQSSSDWESIGSNPVNITYRWFNKNGDMVSEGERTKLDGLEICSGEIKEQFVKVVSPSRVGAYKLYLTLVQEGIKWFDDPCFSGKIVSVTVA